MISKKNSMIIIGIMTGTSLDSVDIAVVKFYTDVFEKTMENLRFDLLAFDSISISQPFRDEILRIISEPITIKQVSQSNFYLSKLYADTVNTVLASNDINIDEIDAVAIHGQTVWHNPDIECFVDADIASTLQLANASALSVHLNKLVISDFRSADVALGGQGAPLVPIFDYYLLRSKTDNIIALNIGGMSNITVIPINSKIDDVIAYDSGPGNVLIDSFMHEFFHKNYDDKGEIARTGNVCKLLLEKLLDIDYLTKLPPKSCGREIFNKNIVDDMLAELNNSNNRDNSNKINCNDIIRTLTEFTALTITNEINKMKFKENKGCLIIKGGGVNNIFLIELIKNNIANNIQLKTADELGIDSQMYEAIAFAFLGFLTLHNKQGNIPNVTGAKSGVVLGTIAKNIRN